MYITLLCLQVQAGQPAMAAAGSAAQAIGTTVSNYTAAAAGQVAVQGLRSPFIPQR